MPRRPKICTIQPEGGSPGARPDRSGDEVAAAERVDNVRVMPLRSAGSGRPRAAVERLKLWENGRTLRVRFLDGQPVVQQKVEAIAKEWEAVANLTLQFVTSGAAELRVSFAEQGFSWSTVGTDALTVPRTQPTMNYGWLEPGTATREYQRVVRHEFGHALGMIHEHQNPDALGKIPWDKPKVYAYYAQQGWSQRGRRRQHLRRLRRGHDELHDVRPDVDHAVRDPRLVDDRHVLGRLEHRRCRPRTSSFMRSQYPAAAPGTVELGSAARGSAADLGGPAEVDTYHFDVATAATHIMTTTGATDTVLTLHGPSDPARSWRGTTTAAPGATPASCASWSRATYWLSVRHKEPGGTGTYDIGVTTRKS